MSVKIFSYLMPVETFLSWRKIVYAYLRMLCMFKININNLFDFTHFLEGVLCSQLKTEKVSLKMIIPPHSFLQKWHFSKSRSLYFPANTSGAKKHSVEKCTMGYIDLSRRQLDKNRR